MIGHDHNHRLVPCAGFVELVKESSEHGVEKTELIEMALEPHESRL